MNDASTKRNQHSNSSTFAKVKKAVIPAAGLGTRFLPATKTVPKEMLTIVDAPTILYVVEEAVAAGIEDIILVQGRGKTAIEDFFDISYELEDKLLKDGRTNVLERLSRIKDMANIISIRQKKPLGLGHAVLTAKPIVGNEPFAILLGDEIMISEPGTLNTTSTLVNWYNETQESGIAVMAVEEQEVSKYGIVEIDETNEVQTSKSSVPFKIKSLIEKPKPTETKSRWAIPGRYVLNAKIFDYLLNTQPGKGGEIQLTDAMALMIKDHVFRAFPVNARRFDAGDKFGFIKANVELALSHKEIGDDVRRYLIELAKTL